MNSLLRPSLLLIAFMVFGLASGVAMAQDEDLDPANTKALASPDAPADPAADAIGKTPNEGNNTKTRRELCTSACNRDYDICGDEGSASRDSMNDRPSADQIDTIRCKGDLEECLKGCRAL